LRQNIHFGAKTRKTSFYVLSLFLFLQSKRITKKVPKKRKKKHAIVYISLTAERLNGCKQAKLAFSRSLLSPKVIRLRLVVVQFYCSYTSCAARFGFAELSIFRQSLVRAN
jgi:hypothetical protein